MTPSLSPLGDMTLCTQNPTTILTPYTKGPATVSATHEDKMLIVPRQAVIWMALSKRPEQAATTQLWIPTTVSMTKGTDGTVSPYPERPVRRAAMSVRPVAISTNECLRSH